MYTINSSRLRAYVAEPNVDYNTCRFDRAAFVPQVILDGLYKFGTYEFYGGSLGEGFCNEYIFDPLSKIVKKGEKYLKLGVGLITKDDEEVFNNKNQYPIDPFTVHTEVHKDYIEFVTEPRECMGYAMAQKKILSVNENRMTLHTEATNTGAKVIAFQEYAHNFVTLNHQQADDKCLLELPGFNFPKGSVSRTDAPMIADERGIIIPRAIDKASYLVLDEENSVKADKGLMWRLSSKTTDLSISESVDFKPGHCAVWAISDDISAEVFLHAELKPGETICWTREWIFDKKSDCVK